MITIEGTTVEEATQKAIETAKAEFEATEEEIEVKVVQEPIKKMFGRKPAIVQAALTQEAVEKRAQKKREEELAAAEKQRLAEEEKKRVEEEILNEIKQVSDLFPELYYSIIQNLYDAKAYHDADPDTMGDVDYLKHFYRALSNIVPVYQGQNYAAVMDNIKAHMDDYSNGYKYSYDSETSIIPNNTNHLFYYFYNGYGYSAEMDNWSYAVFLMYYGLSFPKEYALAKEIHDNEEFLRILKNTYPDGINAEKLYRTNRTSEDKKLYELYTSFYLEAFSQKYDGYILLDKSFVAMSIDKQLQFEAIQQMVCDTGVDVEKIVLSYDVGENIPFLEYIKNTINENKLDGLFASEIAQKLMYYFVLCCVHYAMKLRDRDSMLKALYDLPKVYDYEKLYFEKYCAIHPEVQERNSVICIKNAMGAAVTGVDFENALKLLYEYLGYKVETTKTTGDQGADLLMHKDGIKYVVQAKYYSGNVGNKAVQEVVAAKSFYDAEKGIVVTNSDFTKAARELAEANKIQLVDGKTLSEMLEKL